MCIYSTFSQHLENISLGDFKTALSMTVSEDNIFVRKDKRSDKKSTDTWNSPCLHTVYLLLFPQALCDTFYNAVIQKSCYHALGNEIQ